MSRVDFYFIPQTGPQARLLFACRLLEKAYSQQQQVYVYVEDAEKARFFDQLLWTFRDDSFVPHQPYEKKTLVRSPIYIGYTPAPDLSFAILLNLQVEIPPFYSHYQRILEIVSQEPASLAQAAKHRQFYEEKAYTLYAHQLNK